jgi:hypothetical protein
MSHEEAKKNLPKDTSKKEHEDKERSREKIFKEWRQKKLSIPQVLSEIL